MLLLFLLYSLAWFTLLAGLLHRYLDRRTASLAAGALALWLLYASVLAYRGLLSSPSLPPRLLLILVPFALFIVWMARAQAPLVLARRVPLRLLVGLQAFRIGVEIFLDGLWKAGILPRGMTWHGHNFDIVTGITAALLYVFWNRLPKPEATARVWNYAGLLLVAQVAITGVLSAPGPQQVLNRETPNLAILTFPYVLIAALFVVSAVALHLLALRKLADQAKPGSRTATTAMAASRPETGPLV